MFGFNRKKIFVTRDKQGNWSYSKGGTNWLKKEYFALYLNNPVLNNVINIGASYLSKYKFGIKQEDGAIDYSDASLSLLNNPNPFQSKEDFLKQYYVLRSVYGYVYQKPFGTTQVDAIYNLNTCNISHNFNNKPFLFSAKKYIKPVEEMEFVYSDGNKDRDYKYKDIIPFYDTINGVGEDNNPYISPSKLDSLIKVLSNIDNVLDGENRALNKIGSVAVFAKEKSGSGDIVGMDDTKPLNPREKQDLKAKFNDPDDRTLLPNKALDKIDLSIPLKNLALNESFSRNQGVVAQAFGLSNELYNYLTKGSTFENQEKAEIRYIQNYIDPIAQDLASSWTTSFGDVNNPIVATIDHAPTMANTELQKANRAKVVIETVKMLMDLGYTNEQAFNQMNERFGINLNN